MNREDSFQIEHDFPRSRLASYKIEVAFPIDRLALYRGIPALGSGEDTAILSIHLEINSPFHDVENALWRDGLTADAGLVNGIMFQPKDSTVLLENFDNPEATFSADFASQIIIDWRLRWCRCYLDSNGFPIDCEEFVLVYERTNWCYASEPINGSESRRKSDPLDYVVGNPYFMHSIGWYAAKLLGHYRRARYLELLSGDPLVSSASIPREWMLFGECWSTMKLLFEQKTNVIRGQKTLASARNGGNARKGNFATESIYIIEEMTRLLEMGKPVTDAAAAIFRRGKGTSGNANRALWYRHSRKNL